MVTNNYTSIDYQFIIYLATCIDQFQEIEHLAMNLNKSIVYQYWYNTAIQTA